MKFAPDVAAHSMTRQPYSLSPDVARTMALGVRRLARGENVTYQRGSPATKGYGKGKGELSGKGMGELSDSPNLGRIAHTRRRIRFNMNIWQHSPVKPAKGNSKVQKACKRAFIAFDGPISTSDALEWWLPMAKRYTTNQYITIKRSLERLGAKKVGRASSIGRPWLWIWANNAECPNSQ